MRTDSDAKFWDRNARKYAREPIADPAGYEHSLQRTLQVLNRNDRVLELGCGTGSTALRIAAQVRSYLGTDVSPAMIRIADEKQAAANIPALAFAVATAETPTLEAGAFDVVLGFNYLHLVRDVPDTLRRIHHLLKPNGTFVSKTPCLGDMNPLFGGVFLPVMRALGRAPHVNVLREVELYAQIRSAGFEVLAVEDHATTGKVRRPFMVASRHP